MKQAQHVDVAGSMRPPWTARRRPRKIGKTIMLSGAAAITFSRSCRVGSSWSHCGWWRASGAVSPSRRCSRSRPSWPGHGTELPSISREGAC